MTKRGRLLRKLRRTAKRLGTDRNGKLKGWSRSGIVRHIGMDFVLTLKRRKWRFERGLSCGFSDRERAKLGITEAQYYRHVMKAHFPKQRRARYRDSA